ncbi:hypothetical protein MZO42_08655 [Sphingomonas psychrotolerans]|uniref:Haemolysin activator HlyB C-terminal domain-containing protein n=1 Tax=Sphingomonas psychrotolerans TaxID=1327635 RepID=A0ABU3N2R1_9SPHN|nr:ShlB/FhaC/HecB family hemolysin secretion/activation protein [Sphingomonas psychrotolerans]MDT8758767.1 hypothetical protein [Sphingomonas psychrotolerans]
MTYKGAATIARHIRLAPSLTVLAATLAALPASAQVVPGQLPSREQVQPPVPESLPAPRARVDGRSAFRAVDCPFETSTQQVALAGLRFEGQDGAELAPEILRLLGDLRPQPGSQPVAQLCALRDEANRILQSAGYVASVQILPQQIDNGGQLILTVISARLVRLEVEGETGRYARLVAERAERLKALYPFNQFEAERMLLLMGDIPGLSVDLTLRPAGTRPGEVVGTLAVAYRPIAITGNLQNYGGRSAGRESAYARVDLYGLTGLADVTYIGGSTTFDLDEQQVLQLGHGMGLGADGIRLDGSLTLAWSQPDIGALDLRSTSTVATLALSTPVRRGLTRNLNASLGLDLIEQRTDVHFAGVRYPLTRDRLRVGFARLAGNISRPSQSGHGYRASAALEARQGLAILGASERFDGIYDGGYTPSNESGDPTATILRADLDGQVGLGPVFSLAGAARAQLASGPLLNYEKFSVGSLTVGRGYDPGAGNGDSAIGLRGEVRTAAWRGQRLAAELFGFYDQAWLWNEGRFDENHRALASFGGGVRAAIDGKFLLEATYARPLDRLQRIDRSRPGPRLLLSLTTQFSAAFR